MRQVRDYLHAGRLSREELHRLTSAQWVSLERLMDANDPLVLSMRISHDQFAAAQQFLQDAETDINSCGYKSCSCSRVQRRQRSKTKKSLHQRKRADWFRSLPEIMLWSLLKTDIRWLLWQVTNWHYSRSLKLQSSIENAAKALLTQILLLWYDIARFAVHLPPPPELVQLKSSVLTAAPPVAGLAPAV